MKLYMTGVSAAAIAVAMAGAAAAQQDEGAGQQPGGERGAAEFTCDDLSKMDTARLPGALYFIAGHHVGATEGEGGGNGGQQAADGSNGEETAADAQSVQLSGFFEIPIEGTIIACAENPDALVADVIAEQSESGGPVEDEEADEEAAPDDAATTGEEAAPEDASPAAAPAEEDAASGEDADSAPTDNAESGGASEADIEAGGAEGVSTTREPGGVRGGEIVSPEDAAEDDADAPGAGGTNN